MDNIYMSRVVFIYIIVWLVEIFRTSGGSNITWYEPPPSETVSDTAVTSVTHKNLTKGFVNQELTCSFDLTVDMSLVIVTFELGSTVVASYFQNRSSVTNSFARRFNATWVPTKLTLIVFNVTSTDRGEYLCRVQANSDVLKTWQRKIEVDVLVQSQIISISGKSVTEGANVTLKCLSEGNPMPSFTWTRLSDNSVVTMPLINIRRQDAGKYRCTADNGVGKAASKDVRLIVQYPPEVNGSGKNATVARGVEHTFSCPVDANPVPNITWFNGTEAYSGKHFKTGQSGCFICVARNIHGISDNITQCLIIDASPPLVPPNTAYPSKTMVSSITVSQNSSKTMVSSITASLSPSSSSTTAPQALPPWIIILAVAGGVLVLAILVGVLTWWVYKQRKDSKFRNSNLGRHDDEGGYSQVQGAYAQSGPPEANGTDGAADQGIEVAAAIPTYAVVDKLKKKKKLQEEVPPVYAEVDKSKKKKKRVDDKNLYKTLDEPKKARKPGELLYADLGDFQNPGMSPVSISPQPLPTIKKPVPYESTDYADITQFRKGNVSLPQNDDNEDTEMKPKRPSKKKIQGNDNETPI